MATKKGHPLPAAISVILAFAVLFAFFLSCRKTPPRPLAANGVIDLRSWNFASDGPVQLAGEWRFERLMGDGSPDGERTLRTVPDQWTGDQGGASWGRGYGEYSLTVLLPPGAGPLAIRNMTMATAFSLSVDGALVDMAGTPGASRAASVPAYDAEAVAVATRGDTMELAVRVSNWEYRSGGMWRALSLGPESRIMKDKLDANVASMILFAALAAIGLNSLILYYFRKKDQSYLYFHGFTVMVALRTLVTGEYLISEFIPRIPFDLVIRLEYLTLYAAPMLFFLYYTAFFPLALGKRARWAIALLPAPFLLALPFLPLTVLTRTTFPFYFVLVAIVGVLAVVHLWKVMPREKSEGAILAAGGTALVLSALNDVLFSSFVISTFDMVPLGLSAFVLAQALVLARRFQATFSRAERLAVELGSANASLEAELRKNEEARLRLEELLEEKELLIKEVHHRVKNSLQVVSSIMSLQAGRAGEARDREALRSMRLRISSISLVHEKLYGAVSSGSVDLVAYLRDLAALLDSGYGDGGPASVALDSSLEEYRVSVDACVDSGLMLNELVANAFKYGASADGRAKVRILLAEDAGALILRVEDGGRGFPENFRVGDAKTLGLTMVETLLKRSGGSMACRNAEGGKGAVVELRIPRLEPDREP